VRFKVRDTGCGLTGEEKELLFERFSQASPRTHAQYGGSGLGLFISRQLAELHGGQIGVASEAGVGSTFGFFIAGRRADPPRHITPLGMPLVGRDIGEKVSVRQRTPLRRQDLDAIVSPASLVMAHTSSAFEPKDLHILVVEDNLINQKSS